MARLSGVPARSIVLGLKGAIDFYSWKGIPVARRWPRSPGKQRAAPVQEQWADFKLITQGFRDIDVSVMPALSSMASGTQLTTKDVAVQLFYGYALSETQPGYPLIPPPFEDSETMLQADLATSPTSANQTIPINSVGYSAIAGLSTVVDFSITSYNRFRIVIDGHASTVGQFITAQLVQTAFPGVPLSPPGDDLQIDSIDAVYDSGWLAINPVQTTVLNLSLAMKGSDATVDLVHRGVRVIFAYVSP
jgi:hypothetical protein